MQGNAIQIPIVSTLKTNSNIEKRNNSPKDPWLKHSKKVSLSYININSVRNKLETLSEFVCTQVDFLVISETKLDISFPAAQFNLSGFKTPYRKDIIARSAGLLVYINEDIPYRMISIRDFPSDIQILLVEIKSQKAKADICSNTYTTTVLGDFNIRHDVAI